LDAALFFVSCVFGAADEEKEERKSEKHSTECGIVVGKSRNRRTGTGCFYSGREQPGEYAVYAGTEYTVYQSCEKIQRNWQRKRLLFEKGKELQMNAKSAKA
jgi:hypothetical protein